MYSALYINTDIITDIITDISPTFAVNNLIAQIQFGHL